MNVKDLKEKIKDLPDDMGVILQKDSEGNGYSPLYECDSDCVYLPDSTYSGEVYSLGCSHDDVYMSNGQWETTKQGPKVLVLVPTN